MADRKPSRIASRLETMARQHLHLRFRREDRPADGGDYLRDDAVSERLESLSIASAGKSHQSGG